MNDSQINWIENQLPEMTRLLERWSSINSYSYHLPGLAKMIGEISKEVSLLVCEQQMIDLPPMESVNDQGELTRSELGKCLVARKRPDAPIKVLLGIHYDTVYPIDHPFQKPT